MCYKGEQGRKIFQILLQGTEKSIFIVILCIGCDIITTMILQSTISWFNLFRIESFGSCVLLWRASKIPVEVCSKEQNRIFIVLFWIGFIVIFFHFIKFSVCSFKLCMLTSEMCFIVCAYSWLIAVVVHNVSLASLVPIFSHYYINNINSPLSSTLRDMTIL